MIEFWTQFISKERWVNPTLIFSWSILVGNSSLFSFTETAKMLTTTKWSRRFAFDIWFFFSCLRRLFFLCLPYLLQGLTFDNVVFPCSYFVPYHPHNSISCLTLRLKLFWSATNPPTLVQSLPNLSNWQSLGTSWKITQASSLYPWIY